MTPFAECFHRLRIKHAVRQTELAILMGYEQTYLSALELDKKGPPTEDFIQRFVDVLDLSYEEHAELLRCAKASERKWKIEADLLPDAYWLIDELRDRLPKLSAAQIAAVRSIISIQDSQIERPIKHLRNIISRKSQEAIM